MHSLCLNFLKEAIVKIEKTLELRKIQNNIIPELQIVESAHGHEINRDITPYVIN
jgi:hypothetical protein